MLVIADSSPLHYLVLIEQTDILPALFGHVIIPPVVAEELQRPQDACPGACLDGVSSGLAGHASTSTATCHDHLAFRGRRT
jgi:hypothetical protein